MPRTRFAALAWLAALMAVPVTAQLQTPGAGPRAPGVVVKGKAPVSDETLRIKLPRPREADLPNGIHLMVLEDRRLPQVTFTLVVPGAGGYADPAALPGLASFTAAMMREGTTTRSSAQFSEQLETIAATLTVDAGLSSIDATITGSSLTEHVDRLIELASDVILNPSFAEDELMRYKQRTRAGLIQQRSVPSFLANELYAKVLYGTHPAARVAPDIGALDKVSRADLVAFHRSKYVPDHAVLAVAGDISLAEARKLVEARLGAWTKTSAPAPQAADPPNPATAGVHLVARPNSVQTSFIVGTQAIKRTDSDYDVVSVMNRVIGGGPTARLFLNLREEKGYTYGAYSSVSAGRFRGDWRALTDVRAEVTEPALGEILAEITRLRSEPVPDKEFQDVKRSLVASFALSLESPQQVLNLYLTGWQYKLPADYWDRYPDRIRAVTQAQVQAAARKYLDASRLQIVAVSNPDSVNVLRKYGMVATYDTEGRKTGSE
jgi:predicted Zn-dependent peptidase